jgi:hypothetical protein
MTPLIHPATPKIFLPLRLGTCPLRPTHCTVFPAASAHFRLLPLDGCLPSCGLRLLLEPGLCIHFAAVVGCVRFPHLGVPPCTWLPEAPSSVPLYGLTFTFLLWTSLFPVFSCLACTMFEVEFDFLMYPGVQILVSHMDGGVCMCCHILASKKVMYFRRSSVRNGLKR